MYVLGREGKPDLVSDIIFVRGIDFILITFCGKGHVVFAGHYAVGVKVIFHFGDLHGRAVLQTPGRGVGPSLEIGLQGDAFLYLVHGFEKY